MFKAWPKIPRVENETFWITEKIDGTNACVVIVKDDYEVVLKYNDKVVANVGGYALFAQSRSRFIIPGDDNFGFAKWVSENAGALLELGEGYHYGEWWGKGIQRGYDLDHKRFSLFNPSKFSAVTDNVPMLASFTGISSLSEELDDLAKDLKFGGSVAAPGYMRPEGMVVYGDKSKSSWKHIIDK